MEYRKLKSGVSISLLGFGCMRFPIDNSGRIERALSLEMIDTAFKAGVNYYDTAYVYHDGESEEFLSQALGKYPRDSYYIATKLPVWRTKTVSDAKQIFETQLKRLNTDYIDFYAVHSLCKRTWDNTVNSGIMNFLDELKREGKIKHLGFSFHDEYEAFEEILKSRQWDFCMIQLNYMDTEYQAGLAGYKLALERAVPAFIMEPLKGGRLTQMADGILSAQSEEFSSASLAFRWLTDLPDIKLILSGMSSLSQVKENLKIFSAPRPLSDSERKLIEQISGRLRGRAYNGCTMCGYCKNCPAGIDIQRCFRIWNDYGIYKNLNGALWSWENELNDKQKPHNCTECGKCEEICPQKIEIIRDLKKLEEQLTNN